MGRGWELGRTNLYTDKGLETKGSKEIIIIISNILPSAPPEAQQL